MNLVMVAMVILPTERVPHGRDDAAGRDWTRSLSVHMMAVGKATREPSTCKSIPAKYNSPRVMLS